VIDLLEERPELSWDEAVEEIAKDGPLMRMAEGFRRRVTQ
jgi:hypothetical protein